MSQAQTEKFMFPIGIVEEFILDAPHVASFIQTKRIPKEWKDKWFRATTPYFVSEEDPEDEENTQMCLGKTSYGYSYVKRIKSIAKVLQGLFDAGDGELEYYANEQKDCVALIIAGEFAFFIAPRVSGNKISVSFTK